MGTGEADRYYNEKQKQPSSKSLKLTTYLGIMLTPPKLSFAGQVSCSQRYYNPEMNRKLLLAIVVNFILVVSIYSLFTLVNKKQEEVDETSRLRFLCFIGIHALLIVSMILVVNINDLYFYVLLGFVDCLLIVTTLYICEKRVSQIQADPHYAFNKFNGSSERQELTYLNIYFLVYMYSIIGLVTSGLFLFVTELLICYQEHLINVCIQRCLLKLSYDQASMKGKECAICLQDFEEDTDETFVQVKICKHIFHEKCLVEWIVHNKTCPLDRKNIFDQEEGANESE